MEEKNSIKKKDWYIEIINKWGAENTTRTQKSTSTGKWSNYLSLGELVKLNKESEDYHSNNHIHLFNRGEDGSPGYSIKKNGESYESGIFTAYYTLDQYVSYFKEKLK